MTTILGISAFYHDAAAALIVDGEIVAAAQEERFSRKKHDPDFPQHAIDYCLASAGLNPGDLDYVGYYDKPYRTFERLLETYLSFAPVGYKSFAEAMPLWVGQKLHMPRELRRGLRKAYRKNFVFGEHHESHAASAFFPSPFEEAAILTMDGVGEWATTSFGVGRGNKIELTDEIRFPHSLGLLYSAFTYYTGFKVNEGEYKLMGLAPYGEPEFADLILEHLIDLKDDGSFRLHLDYFNYCQGLTMTSKKFDKLFGGPPRAPDAEITQRDMNLAASIQRVTEEVMLRCARHIHAETGMTKLCMAGGVALNCVANGRILRESPFDDIWMQPAAGDAGGALGVALFIWHQLLGNARTPQATDSQRGSRLGPAYSSDEIRKFLDEVDAVYEYIDDEQQLCDTVADDMADGKVIGWFQGAMEFGPRALGSRSIVGDPRNTSMQTVMNMKVKFRESFRPFAPAVLREHTGDYFGFDSDRDSPYMMLVTSVNESRRLAPTQEQLDAVGIDKLVYPRSELPAITHVDYSARIQTVDAGRAGIYHRLIDSFYRKTGCPVVVNTSFNLGWEPIVCSPRDAYQTFMSSDIDVLCLGQFVLRKTTQPGAIGTSNGSVPSETIAPARDFLEDLWLSPCCRAELKRVDGAPVCSKCDHHFPETDGIPQLFWPHEKFQADGDVTDTVKAFYEETPFPNYDDHDSVRSLIDKSRAGIYAKSLDEAIPYNTNVLEVGCGTGQLSNFLGIACRHVVGADLCLNSLRLANGFRREHGSPRVRFIQMNLFRPALKPESFDVLLCNGVLHHTSDPRGGFQGLLPLVRPGGYVVIGLYNKYGRLATDMRRSIFRLAGGRGKWLDPHLRSLKTRKDKLRAWFADQYLHPHESKHTIGEVLEWFAEDGLEFVRGIPAVIPGGESLGEVNLFDPTPAGTAVQHLLVELGQIVKGNREGGFFLMIGRKPMSAAVTTNPARSN